jgi:hypothetical protein
MSDDISAALARIEGKIDKLGVDVMTRIDRLQNALTLQREEQVVDQASILLIRRQIQHIQDRLTSLEGR